jgi:hypothetical protein
MERRTIIQTPVLFIIQQTQTRFELIRNTAAEVFMVDMVKPFEDKRVRRKPIRFDPHS